MKPAYRYFFANDKKITVKNKRIIKFDPFKFLIKGEPLPEPNYETLEELYKKDKKFKEFKKKKSNWKIITLEENIITATDHILQSDYDDSQAGNMLLHIVKGDWGVEKFTGMHYLPTPHPDYIVNFRIIKKPNKSGVYSAKFEIRNEQGELMLMKKSTSMFPDDWSRQSLYDECVYALKNRIKTDEQGKSHYISKTLSGIPVRIYFTDDGRKIKTLFPIRRP